MVKRNPVKSEDDELPADFTLVYRSHGTVELHDADNKLAWSSDADEEFAEEFEGDFFSDEEDTDEILDYLNEQGLIDLDDDEIDIIENDADDESGYSDNVLEGSFIRKN